MKAEKFLKLLEQNGFNYFTGVPCSYLKSLIGLLEKRPNDFHTPALREDIAVGLAAGAYLGGKMPVIYMQNSGLGYSLEAFSSIHMIYHIPGLILVTYRGPEDKGWEEHKVMGENTEKLLEIFGFKYSILNENISETEMIEIKAYITKEELPWFVLINKGILE